MGIGTLPQAERRQAVRSVGIVAALRAEARSLSRRVRSSAPLQLGAGAWLALSGGVGAASAVAAGEILLGAGAEALVSWGTAGALDPALAAGDLLLPERIVDGAGEEFWPDAGWRSRVQAGLDGSLAVHAGTLLQSPAVAATARDKQLLRERVQAAAVDMESAALARLARQRQVPFLAVRAIADTASTAIPRMVGDALDEDGRLRPMRLLGNACRRPGELPALFVLAGDFRAARTTLEVLAESAAAGLFVSDAGVRGTRRCAGAAAPRPCSGAGGP